MNITRVVPNTNILIYLIPPFTVPTNMFVQQNMIHVSLKLINSSKETDGPRIMTRNIDD